MGLPVDAFCEPAHEGEALLSEETFRAKGQIGRGCLAEQVAFGKRRALVGQSALIGDKRHAAGEALLAQGGCALEAGVSGSEYHDALHGQLLRCEVVMFRRAHPRVCPAVGDGGVPRQGTYAGGRGAFSAHTLIYEKPLKSGGAIDTHRACRPHGRIGSRIAQEALARGHHVVEVLRADVDLFDPIRIGPGAARERRPGQRVRRVAGELHFAPAAEPQKLPQAMRSMLQATASA
ncbi:hypothetical protein [Ramlibacter sp. 2FC]|uniref:hypothetical protein n=1 Tax=Ramlibacter sp. 2FC TaxID=2502188 RepID=UPI00201D95BC|nr:hypothetical protein [Ramlibacter sp. 2FC]